MLYVSTKPLALGKGNKFGNACALAALPAKATLTATAKTVLNFTHTLLKRDRYLIVRVEYTSFQLRGYDSFK